MTHDEMRRRYPHTFAASPDNLDEFGPVPTHLDARQLHWMYCKSEAYIADAKRAAECVTGEPLAQRIEEMKAERDSLLTRVRASEAALAALPKTADGVPIAPGSRIVHRFAGGTRGGQMLVRGIVLDEPDPEGRWQFATVYTAGGGFARVEMSDLFSSHDAAAAALAAHPQPGDGAEVKS